MSKHCEPHELTGMFFTRVACQDEGQVGKLRGDPDDDRVLVMFAGILAVDKETAKRMDESMHATAGRISELNGQIMLVMDTQGKSTGDTYRGTTIGQILTYPIWRV